MYVMLIDLVGELGLLSQVEGDIQPHEQSPQHLLKGRLGTGRIEHICRNRRFHPTVQGPHGSSRGADTFWKVKSI